LNASNAAKSDRAHWAQTNKADRRHDRVITRFMRGDGTECAKYGIPGNMHMQGVFTLIGVDASLMAMASFRNDRIPAQRTRSNARFSICLTATKYANFRNRK
jgi:hypothetical protein